MKLYSLAGKALVALAMALPALPAAAAGDAAAAAQAAQAAQAAPEKAEEAKICKKFDMTGSRTRARKVCLTAEQWRKLDTQDL